MKTADKHVFLSALFLAVYVIIEFTEIFGDPTWFKFFLIIAFVTFLISGVSQKIKNQKK